MVNIAVVKRDGVRETFDTDKMKRVCLAAGLEPSQADAATAEMIAWLNTLNVTEISSLKLRDQLVSVMHKIHEPAAQMYIWYESTKDKIAAPAEAP